MSKLDQLKALGDAKRKARANPFQDAARGRDPQPEKPHAKPVGRNVAKAKPPAVAKKRNSGRSLQGRSAAKPFAQVDASKVVPASPRTKPVKPTGSVKPKGRPAGSIIPAAAVHTKPWVAEGLSRAQWYRRRAEGKAK